MSNCIKVAKITGTMKAFEIMIERINRKIDKQTKKGKYNEDAVYRNFVGSNDQGRCWSF